MDLNIKFENTYNNDVEEEHKFLDINNLVPEIEASYIGAPLSQQTIDILNEFERNEKGGVIRESNQSLLNYSKLLEEKVKEISPKYMEEIQKINPEVPLENIPLYLLSSPVNRIACALKGEGIAINTRYFFENQKDDKFLANTLVHEATHIFIKKLGKQPEFVKGDYKRDIFDFFWFEGLAQYMEPYPNEISEMFKEDEQKWPELISSWFNTDSIKEKDLLINTITNMESFKKIMEYRHGINYEKEVKDLLEKTSPDEALRTLIVQEGFGYYIGKTLWEQEIKKGSNLKDLVMKGSKDIDNWVE